MLHFHSRRARRRRRRVERLTMESLEPRTVLAADGHVTQGIAVISDGVADAYELVPDLTAARSWIELLAANQGVNLGRFKGLPDPSWGASRSEGYEFLWGAPTPLPQMVVDGVLSQIASGDVSLVSVGFGHQYLAQRYGEIYAGTLQGAALQQLIDTSVGATLNVADTISATGRAKVVLQGFDDLGQTPYYQEIYPDAVGRQRVRDATRAANSKLNVAADARYMPVVDRQRITALASVSAPLAIGGLVLDSQNNPADQDSANDFFIDAIHPGTIVSGMIANAFIEAANRAYDAELTPLTEQEILAKVGITTTAVGPSFYNVSSLVHFNSLPTARTDVMHVLEQVPFEIPLLKNDFDPESDPLVVRSVSSPAHGTVALHPNGSITYTSRLGFEGVEFFSYELSDGRDRTVTGQIEVAVLNAEPVLRSTQFPTTAVPGQPLSFNATFSDSGSADEHEGQWNWGDRSNAAGVITKASGLGTVWGSKSYREAGTYQVKMKVRDEAGGSAEATQEIQVRPITIGPALGRPNALLIGGTPGNDMIQIRDLGARGLKVSIGGREVASFPVNSVSAIAVYGQAGDDVIVLEKVTIPAFLDGGDGNDYLLGGSASDIILGGAGDDTIYAGLGQNVVIGGGGSDVVAGNRGEDLLIGSSTTFDANGTALTSLLAEWSRTDVTYENRVAHLRFGGGWNGANVLTSDTVRKEATPNRLQGGEGRDWYFAQLSRVGAAADKLLGRNASEWIQAVG